MGWRYGLWFAGVFRGADDDGVRPLAVEIRLPLVAFFVQVFGRSEGTADLERRQWPGLE